MILNDLYQKFPTTSKPDFTLFWAALWLLVTGFVMIMSSSNIIGDQLFDNSFYFVNKHIIFIILGSIAFMITYIVPHQVMRKFSVGIWVVALILVIMTHLPGVGIIIGGSSRWLRVLGITFQPSELMKFALILLTADYLEKYINKINEDWQAFLVLLGIIGFSTFLVLIQPDLGTTIIIGIAFMCQLFVAGIRLDWLAGLSLTGVIAFLLSILTSSYQMARIQAWINPWSDPQGTGFQTIQSLIAIGTGGFLGLGLGQSRQKFFYLPQQYTDFIFAIICEEIGFLRTTIFLLLPLIIFYTRCFHIAAWQKDTFSKLLVIGITAWLGFQSLVNISVALNVMPMTGITLPFISFGGTSIVITMAMTGIILNASRYKKGMKQ